MRSKPVKLLALDEEDLKIVSAHCQDAVTRVGDITYLPGEKRLLLPINRFVWEQDDRSKERRQSLLHFARVARLRSQGIDRSRSDQPLVLLAVVFEATENPAGHVDLIFSGDFQLRLDVECIEAQLTDMQAAWQAQSVPKHDT